MLFSMIRSMLSCPTHCQPCTNGPQKPFLTPGAQASYSYNLPGLYLLFSVKAFHRAIMKCIFLFEQWLLGLGVPAICGSSLNLSWSSQWIQFTVSTPQMVGKDKMSFMNLPETVIKEALRIKGRSETIRWLFICSPSEDFWRHLPHPEHLQ